MSHRQLISGIACAAALILSSAVAAQEAGPDAADMGAKTRAVCLTLVLVQALHSLDKYAFEF